ncbi:monooxygenase [Amycolatopsis sulphurea]|uniref:Monooxygenase n=1 Tax=Amycolatopsis sulphurea TaxID=76022 RepID=V9XUX6_9PSEU|nr:FAD-dependent monooxygenase [Amycolatopsis sulphurea]AHD25936.1 putative oxygenase [Amycolatopsis sulphurea]PFG50044.1 monooxygenase [Amycolatopsis sulphurea]
MTDIRTDFCVVGGGPAGLTLALLLARSGVRVVVVERSRSFDREYRGEILQPGGQALLAELGVLTPAREHGAHEHHRFLLEEHGKVLINGDYRRLPGPFNCLLSIPQRHLLRELLAQCHEHAGFQYLSGTKVTGLVEDGGRVRGVVCGDDQVVLAHCVIGADGRYSKVRQLAGIPADRVEGFRQDVLWFKLSADGELPSEVRVFRAGGNPVLAYTSVRDRVQFGWTLPHKGYQLLAQQGLAHIKEQLRAAVPGYADRIDEEITSFRDLSLLDVFSGGARQWVRDGLLLIGDSAHTHGPIGAQGINLAIQDAVAAHPLLLESLRANDSSGAMLGRFVTGRKRDIDRMNRIQAVQGKAMLSAGRVSSVVRPRLAMVVARTPIYRAMLRQIAFGNTGIRIRAELFARR